MTKMIIEEIEIDVLKKKIKNLHLSVHPPDGRVRLSVPKSMDDQAIREFVKSRLPWIHKQKAKFKLQKREAPLEFITGESHYFFDDKYILIVIETTGKQRVEMQDNKYLSLYVRPGSTKEKREKILNEWYREQLKQVIPKYIAKWEEVIGVFVKEWGVKRMKTKWGTCNTQAKRIWLNLELVKKKQECLEYIIVHEMTHLLERKHNKKFYEYLSKFLPDWENTRAELNGLL